MEGIYILLGVLAIAILLIVCNIKVVPQAYVYVIERFGAFHAAWGTGLHWKVPLIEKVAKRVSIKEQVVDFQPKGVLFFPFSDLVGIFAIFLQPEKQPTKSTQNGKSKTY